MEQKLERKEGKCRYIRGTRERYETVEFDIFRNRTYSTTCVVNVHLLMQGIMFHPCGNGDTVTLNMGQKLEILEFVQKERAKLLGCSLVKTYQGWIGSGISDFTDYCFPGDTVDREMVDCFVNSVPPLMRRESCTQGGEPKGPEKDPVSGQWRNTYLTFSRKTSSLWRYDGECFRGENSNRARYVSRLQRCIADCKNGSKIASGF